jgi:hypothetical protein
MRAATQAPALGNLPQRARGHHDAGRRGFLWACGSEQHKACAPHNKRCVAAQSRKKLCSKKLSALSSRCTKKLSNRCSKMLCKFSAEKASGADALSKLLGVLLWS